MNDLSRRRILQGALLGAGALTLNACRNPFSASSGSAGGSSSGPVVFGVSAPMTGDSAEYGAIWKKAFDLALAEANQAGGIGGRKIQVDVQDSQAAPRQAVTIAQKFASDDRIVAELGDFASPASMAASSIYERAKLTQFGITDSHPDFTKGGEYVWSNAQSQNDAAKSQADLAHKHGKRHAVVYLDTDWGATVWKIYEKSAKANGDTITYSSGFIASSTDFRPTLIKARQSNPDMLVIIGYYKDAALLTQQARSVGFEKLPIVIANSAYSPQFLALGGTATEGVRLSTTFFADEPRPEVREFVKKWRGRYKETPDMFAAGAYDAINILIWAAKKHGATREGIHQGLLKGKDIPSVSYGPLTFGPDRRVAGARFLEVVVKGGKYVLADGAE
ncbi:ABC transporter substrate-binding protein [Actinomadura vinacea]|uniref:ABC transporter substrate-binding protein n=1 Tax=Actinomadura vinacea TaxID=115336 RepID=A0ABN3JS74_9ACTN